MHAMIFDIDGTLIQSAAVDDDLYRKSVHAVLGSVVFRQSLHEYDYVTDSGVLSQLLVDNSIPPRPDPTAEIRTHFVNALRAHIAANGPFQEVPGAREMLQSLARSEEHAVAIATGGWTESAILKLDSAGFDSPAIPLATADDSWDRTVIMRKALSRLGTDFDSITYYGDGPWDRDACRALGWQFVAVGPVLGGLESYRGLRVA